MAQATLSCRYAAIHLVYHGFYSSRGRKFPNGNFRTSVFCEVKTQIVGKTKFFDRLRLSVFPESLSCFYRPRFLNLEYMDCTP